MTIFLIKVSFEAVIKIFYTYIVKRTWPTEHSIAAKTQLPISQLLEKCLKSTGFHVTVFYICT